jgi:hypothetical protein
MLATDDVAAFEAAGCLLILNHEGLAAEIGEPTFLVNIAYLEPAENITQIQMFFALSLGESLLVRVWHYALDWMPLFVEATAPSLAVLNAIPETEDHPDFLPSEKRVHPGAFPPFFGPWNYLGPDRLNEERRGFLQSLGAYNSRPFGEGWVLQVVGELQDRPSPNFLKRLSDPPEGLRLEYRQPEISR